MSAWRRARVVVAGAVVCGVAVTLGARLRPDSSETSGAGAPDTEWSILLTGRPSALVADGDGSVVVAGAGEVRALSSEGVTQWRVSVPNAGLHTPGLGRGVVVVSAGDQLLALDRDDGSERWSTSWPTRPGPVASVLDRVVFGTEGGELVAVGARDGLPRWSVRHSGAVWSPPAIDVEAGLAVAAWGGTHPRLRAVDLTSGEPRWDEPLARFAATPVVHAGLVVSAEGDGDRHARVVARRSDSGTMVWSTAVPASFESGIEPAIAGPDLAVVDHLGTVTMLDVERGQTRWQVALDRPILRTRVVLTGGAVVLTTYAGEVVALDRGSGRIDRRWRPDGFPVVLASSGVRGHVVVGLGVTAPGRLEALRLH